MGDQHEQHKQNEHVGGIAGLGAGVLAGAAAGSAVMPVLGTFTGALIGGLAGSELGKVVGGAVLDAFTIPPEEMASPSAGGSSSQGSGVDVLDQLERLGQLKAQGVISDEEFKAAKAKLLGM
jgi:phage tail tape-measure protein